MDRNGRISTRAAPLELPVTEPSAWWWTEDALPSRRTHEASQPSIFYGFNFKARVRLPGSATQPSFSEGVIAFTPALGKYKGKVALADEHGTVLGRYDFAAIRPMRDGMAVASKVLLVKGAGRDTAAADKISLRYGFIDRTGKVAIAPVLDAAADFSEERATVLAHGNLAMIDKTGTVLLHGAWKCGNTPVLLDGKNNVLWPAEAIGFTKCKQ
jgi:hypothetical protein